ncbi:LOW QUALITY PROTEIN: protein GPR108 [Glossophaga mutica]
MVLTRRGHFQVRQSGKNSFSFYTKGSLEVNELSLLRLDLEETPVFHVVIGLRAKEDQYSLNFHNCCSPMLGFVMDQEKNPEGFLRVVEIPFKLSMVVSVCFLAAGFFWVSVFCKNTCNVFKIHWLVVALAFTKSVSLLFHSVRAWAWVWGLPGSTTYYFTNSPGHPINSLTVMHYIAHNSDLCQAGGRQLKGVLFITIALISSSWSLVKYVPSNKKIFGIMILIQALANIACVIIESGEEGISDYGLLFLADRICCNAILFPVVCAHPLTPALCAHASVAVNLARLKLFQHYCAMASPVGPHISPGPMPTRVPCRSPVTSTSHASLPSCCRWPCLFSGSGCPSRVPQILLTTGYKFQQAGHNLPPR